LFHKKKKKNNSSNLQTSIFCILWYCFQLSWVKSSACPNYRIQVTRHGNILHFSTCTYRKTFAGPNKCSSAAIYKIIQDSTIKLYYPVSIIVSILKSGTQPCHGHLVLIQKCPVQVIKMTPVYRILINNIMEEYTIQPDRPSESVIVSTLTKCSYKTIRLDTYWIIWLLTIVKNNYIDSKSCWVWESIRYC